MRSETRDGVRRDYATDALGSVTATIDPSGAVENTYRYKPYGATLAKTGSGTDPRYMWTGDTGSRTNNRRNAEQYNRRRHYGSPPAAWTSVDPLWPDESAFGYVVENPASLRDSSGLSLEYPGGGCGPNRSGQFKDACNKLSRILDDFERKQKFLTCLRSDDLGKKMMEALRDVCRNKFKPRICVFCDPGSGPSGVPAGSSMCSKRGVHGETPLPLPREPRLWPGPGDRKDPGCRSADIPSAPVVPTFDGAPCVDALLGGIGDGCDSIVVICATNGAGTTLLHELLHALGIGYQTGHGSGSKSNDFITRFEQCFEKA